MQCLKRNKQVLFLCKKVIENNITKYAEPIKIITDFQPIKSTGEIISIGQEYSQYLKIVDDEKIGKLFENGDKCYVYVEPPKVHDKMCKNADFYVNGTPVISLNTATVSLKRLTGDD